MKPVVLTYSENNVSSRKIAEALDCPRIFPGNTFRFTPDHMVINWGCGYRLGTPPTHILNAPDKVMRSVNKVRSFRFFQANGVPTPPWTEEKDVALDWMRREDGRRTIIFCRTQIEAADGAGLVIARRPEEVVNAPLYTTYQPCLAEYRVHVFRGRVIFHTERKRRDGAHPEVEVRCGDDYYFAWSDHLPDCVAGAAIAATDAVGLDFAGVDVGYNGQVAYVFEVNTAPGSFGRVTLQKYVDAIRSVL